MIVVARPRLRRPDVEPGGELDVLGDVDHDRARPTSGGDAERLVQHVRQVGDVLHQVVVLGAGAGDADRVALLEGVGADQMGRDLAGDHHQRDRVHQRVGDAGDGVGGAWAGGDQHHARAAGRAGVALGGVGRALLVAHQHVAQARLMEEGVVDRQHRAAGIAEQVGDALVDQGADHDLGAGHDLGGVGAGLGFEGGLDGHGTARIRRFRTRKKALSGAFGHATGVGGRGSPSYRYRPPNKYEARAAHRSAPNSSLETCHRAGWASRNAERLCGARQRKTTSVCGPRAP